MLTPRTARRLAASALTPALALALAPAATAASGDYVVRSLTEVADPGLEVTGPLDEFRVVSRARVVVPTDWRRLRAPDGRLRFRTGRTGCIYSVTFTVSSRLGQPGDAADQVAEALPAASSRHVLDEGRRGNDAFRVIREPSSGRVRLRAQWTSVLTRRDDIAPEGQVAWTDVRVSAASGPDDECHSGTYRDVLGPDIGDALAVARARLRFVEED